MSTPTVVGPPKAPSAVRVRPDVTDTRASLRCADVPMCVTDVDSAADSLIGLASFSELSGRGHHVHLCSMDTIVQAHRDPIVYDALVGSTMNLTDGMGLLFAGRLTQPQAARGIQRVSGTEFMQAAWDRGQSAGLRHYLLGSTEEVQLALRRRLLSDFPDAELVGAECPPFRALTESELDEQRDRIAASGAQVVWVGLGCPKQDREVARLAAQLPAVFVAVGAAFDFISGFKRRAPRWMQVAGLEWLFRLLYEPRRLWRRYLLGLPHFAMLLARDLVSARKSA